MMMNVIHLNKEQAEDFIKKYMQNNITVTHISNDYEDGIYFVTLSTSDEGKIKEKVKKSFFGIIKRICRNIVHRTYVTTWQYRPYNFLSSALFGQVHIGLCFGEYVVPGTNNRLDFYEFDRSLLLKANEVVKQKISEWETKSPV